MEFFPIKAIGMTKPPNRPLEVDELIDILDFAKPIHWHVKMLAQGKKPHSFETTEEAVEYYKQMYDSDKLERRLLGTTVEKDEDSKPVAKKKNKRKRESSGDKPSKDNDSGKAPKCMLKYATLFSDPYL